MKIVGFGIHNFRSFGEKGFVVSSIAKINIFIGRNNSGKSNVLGAIQLLSRFHSDKYELSPTDKHQGSTAPIILDVVVSHTMPVQGRPDEDVELTLQYEVEAKRVILNADLSEKWDYQKALAFHNSLTSDRYTQIGREQLARQALQFAMQHARVAGQEVSISKLIYVPAIRDVRPKTDKEPDPNMFDPSGRDIIKHLRTMQIPGIGKERDQEVFRSIERFVADLLNESPDNVRLEIPSEEHDIYVTMNGVRLSLQSYGTGLHELVILCSTLAIYENRWICIEEPELHLHPELIRRFVRFLNTTSNTYFITTHSNVLLDYETKGRVYHVQHDGRESTVSPATSLSANRVILHDLAVRASDLLQANGVIWIEGPSDRTYINKWLTLAGSNFIEGIHYSFVYYGGSLLADVSFADEPLYSNEFIELLRINRNAFVVIDSDLTPAKTILLAYKKRVRAEIGDNRCWITKGKEIENYLRPELVQMHLDQRFPDNTKKVRFGPSEEIEKVLRRSIKSGRVHYSKVRDSLRIVELMTEADLDHLDLKQWINRLLATIESWQT